MANCQCNNQLNDSFDDAAKRFWTDANTLHKAGCLPTADHLYGLSAECALKAIITLGWGGMKKPDKVHLPCIWDQFKNHPNNSFPKTNAQNPFTQWCVDHRYSADQHFTQQRVQDHKKAASDAIKLLEQALLNGQVP